MKELLLVFLSCLHLTAFAQGLTIDKKGLSTIVKVLSSDSLQGRETGTIGARKSAAFISQKFAELGLLPFENGVYEQKFKLKQTYWGDVYIDASGKHISNFVDIIYYGPNSHVEKEATVIFGGEGTDEHLAQINAEGKFVLVFVRNLRSYFDVGQRLIRKKALGLIVANPENDLQFQSIKNTMAEYIQAKRLSLERSDSTPVVRAKWDTLKLLDTFTIANSQIKNIMGASAKQLRRSAATNQIGLIPGNIIKMKCERVERELESSNVVGMIRGSSQKSIVISAHYDHLGSIGHSFYPGADDNASGVAGILYLASRLSNLTAPRFNVIFLATSGEEQGLLGSNYFVNQKSFDSASIVCNLNLDMIARKDNEHAWPGRYLYCLGIDQSPEIGKVIREVDANYTLCDLNYTAYSKPDGIYTRSDQYNFYKKGIPAIHFFSGLHDDYHRVSDTPEKIDFSNLENRIQLISLVIQALQKDKSLE